MIFGFKEKKERKRREKLLSRVVYRFKNPWWTRKILVQRGGKMEEKRGLKTVTRRRQRAVSNYSGSTPARFFARGGNVADKFSSPLLPRYNRGQRL